MPDPSPAPDREEPRASYAPRPASYDRPGDAGQAWVQVTLLAVLTALLLFLAGIGRPVARDVDPVRVELATEVRAALDELRDAIARARTADGRWPGLVTLRGDAVAEEVEQRLERELGRPIPANAWNGASSLRVLPPGAPWPARFDGRSGWVYRPSTGEIRANVPGDDAEVRLADL